MNVKGIFQLSLSVFSYIFWEGIAKPFTGHIKIKMSLFKFCVHYFFFYFCSPVNGGYSSAWLEHQIVVLRVVGSSPISHPGILNKSGINMPLLFIPATNLCKCADRVKTVFFPFIYILQFLD